MERNLVPNGVGKVQFTVAVRAAAAAILLLFLLLLLSWLCRACARAGIPDTTIIPIPGADRALVATLVFAP